MQAYCLATMTASRPQDDRRSGNFSSPMWGNFFESLFSTDTKLKSYDTQIEVLKGKVKDMLMASTSDHAVEKIGLIDLLCRLGVSYHFKIEIEEELKQIFDDQANPIHDDHEHDLYTASLLFRVFRQHGYNMSPDVFKKFKDSDGKFKQSLLEDARGMLSLYEACHLAIRGEEILDDALAFTASHLKSLADQSSDHLSKHMLNALNWPLHQCMTRIATRQFISFYEDDESRNETLLLFAKLDFNKLQLLHQHEISQLTRWYKELNLASKLPYTRSRIVETHLWSMGIYFEPHYSNARIMLNKVITMISLMDDTYDVYGTIEELHLFTETIQRWDSTCLDQLPDYMKIIYGTLLSVFDEWEKEQEKEGRSHSVCYAKDAMKELARGYFVEAQWFNKGYVPSVEEYMSNGLTTSAYGPIITTSFVGMGEIARANDFEWLQPPRPKIVKASQAMGRIMNDIVSHQDEQKRGDAPSFIECYMKQYESSEKEAIEEIENRIANLWKDINQECIRPTAVSLPFLMLILNLTRVTNVFYKYDDGYTTPGRSLKTHIISLFIDPIPLC